MSRPAHNICPNAGCKSLRASFFRRIGSWHARCYYAKKFMSNFFASRMGVILVLAVPLLTASQAGRDLSGRVSDGAAPVAGAIVTVSNYGFVKSVTTDDDGRFFLEALPPGRYEFRTSAQGYAVFECPVIIRSDRMHRNWIDVKSLIPADEQTVSVLDLATRKQAGNRGHRAVPSATRTGV